MIYTTHYHSPIGNILLAEKNSELIGLWMKGQKYFLGSVQGEDARKERYSYLRADKEMARPLFCR